MTKPNLYLALAIIGAVVPYYFFIQHFSAQGLAIGEFLGAVFATSAASGFAVDLVISSLVFWFVMFLRRQRGEGPAPGVFIVLNLFIGLSCALPAYVYASLRYAIEKMPGAKRQ